MKALLKWRSKIRDYRAELTSEQAIEADMKEEKALPTAEEKDEEEEKRVDTEIATLQAKSEHQKKKDKKKKREMKRKADKRMQLNANNLTGADIADSQDTGAFSLKMIPV